MGCLFVIAAVFGLAELALGVRHIAKTASGRMSRQSPVRQFREIAPALVAQLEWKFESWGRYFDLLASVLATQRSAHATATSLRARFASFRACAAFDGDAAPPSTSTPQCTDCPRRSSYLSLTSWTDPIFVAS
jgi:hypothetical protein